RSVAADRGARLAWRADAPRPRRLCHSSREDQRPPRTRDRVRRRQRRALRHLPPAATAFDLGADRSDRHPGTAAAPAPAAESLGQPEWLDRARLRRAVALALGRAAVTCRCAPPRLRPRQRLARP